MTIVNETSITVRGIALPEPASITVSYEPLWAQGSGRMSDGTFEGDIQTYKYRIDVTWKPISGENAKKILSTVYTGNPFFDVRFKSHLTNQYITKKMYVGEAKSNVYNYAVPDAMYESLPLSFVEQ